MHGAGAVRAQAVRNIVFGGIVIVPGVLGRPAVLADHRAEFVTFAGFKTDAQQFPFVSGSAKSEKR